MRKSTNHQEVKTLGSLLLKFLPRDVTLNRRWERGEQRKAWARRALNSRLSAVLAGLRFRRGLAQRRAEHGEHDTYTSIYIDIRNIFATVDF